MKQIQTFIAARCRLDGEASVPCMELYDAWVRWCESLGQPHRGNHGHFCRALKAALPDIKRVVPEGEKRGEYWGIGLTGERNGVHCAAEA